MVRPKWSNYNVLAKFEYPSVVDMCAMINYLMHRHAIDERVHVRQYHYWEGNVFPLWFRVGCVWMFDGIQQITNEAGNYRLYGGKTPMIEQIKTIDEKLREINIDRSLLRTLVDTDK